ncbi:MAG TPA: phosphotransferase [Streptosporangiaceae bacterium]|nr:phosphotransferase [Streptosporangiaceae bacterium]
MHDALPAGSCPFSWAAELRVERTRRAAADGRINPEDQWHPVHLGLSISRALELAADIPPVDLLVVCHGDACAPNTLLTGDGRWSGHVDLDQLGVADRWADLAVATWSTEWNYGPGWQDLLLDAYGIDPDPERISYYRLLWDLDA